MSTRLLQQAIAHLVDELDLEAQDLAGALEVNPRTIDRWCKGETLPQHDARRRLDELLDLQSRLQKVLGSGRGARQWLHTDSRYLGMVKPVEVLRAGRIDRVNAALEAMDEGVFV